MLLSNKLMIKLQMFWPFCVKVDRLVIQTANNVQLSAGERDEKLNASSETSKLQ